MAVSTVKLNGTTLMTVNDTTSVASDVAQGKYFYGADGVKTAGSASGGGGSAYTRTVVVPQQTVTPVSNGTYYSAHLSNATAFIPGEEYIVTWNGTEYFSTCVSKWSSSYILGDVHYFFDNGNYTYPFGMINESNEWEIATDSGSSVTVKVEKLELSPSGGGGASNIVTGTFKGTTTGASMDVTLNYSGSGYPIAAVIYVDEGPYNDSTGTFYDTIQRYAFAAYAIEKSKADVTPNYSGASGPDSAASQIMYKNSSSSATSYGSTYNTNTRTYYQDVDATASTSAAVHFRSSTSMSVFIASASYGFMANVTYRYIIYYSS